MKILFVSSIEPQNIRCLPWRGLALARAIHQTKRLGTEIIDLVSFIQNTAAAQAACLSADILVIQANCNPGTASAIQRWKARDKTVIYDLGPEIGTTPEKLSALPASRQYETIDQNQITLPEIVLWSLRIVDAVTLSSHQLADDLRPFTRVFHLPDYLDLDRYHPDSSMDHEGIMLGWRDYSFDPSGLLKSGVGAALGRVCQARPQVKLIVWGENPRIIQGIPIPPEQLEFHPKPSEWDWPSPLSRVDIGLAPLFGPQDERRSCLEVLEFMSMRIPWIGSLSPAFFELRHYGWLVQNNASTWERLLLDMVDYHEDYRMEAMGEPYLYAISQGIEENIENVIGLFSRIHVNANHELEGTIDHESR